MPETTPTTSAGRELYFIPCTGPKRDVATLAAEMYQGSSFAPQLGAALIAADGDRSRVFVLSAEYGIVGLDEMIEPYERKMGDEGCITAAVVRAQAEALGIEWGADVYAFLPAAYYRILDAALRALDVYAQDVYEAAPGIGYQRGVCRCVREVA